MSTIFDLPHVRKHIRHSEKKGGGGGWGMVCCCGPFHVSGIARLSPLIW